jgi:hypothetical protein
MHSSNSEFILGCMLRGRLLGRLTTIVEILEGTYPHDDIRDPTAATPGGALQQLLFALPRSGPHLSVTALMLFNDIIIRNVISGVYLSDFRRICNAELMMHIRLRRGWRVGRRSQRCW